MTVRWQDWDNMLLGSWSLVLPWTLLLPPGRQRLTDTEGT